MSKKVQVPKKDKWFYSKSRAPFALKKPVGFEEWFYTGGTRCFGHSNDIKKRSRG